jgi:type I restriction enzyme S subunit
MLANGGRKARRINPNEMCSFPIAYPTLYEQKKIAEILTAQDKVIELKQKLIEEKQKQKKYLMQQLLTGKQRLKGFTGEWKNYSFDEVLIIHSTKKYQLTKDKYLNHGKYPIIDQGKNFIVGWSNDESKVFICNSNGMIVFGDHTCAIKYVSFNFIIGADGTQIMSCNKDTANTKYLYYFLCNKNISCTGYCRHFKYIKELIFKIPKTTEQTAIAEILSTADKEIELLEKDLEQEKLKKKSLMQLLLTGIVRVNNEK